MHRFFIPHQNISGDKIIITDKAQLHHIRDVLRLRPSEAIAVFDGKSNEYSVSLEQASAKEAILKIKDKRKAPGIRSIRVSVACAIPKKSKFDDIVDKLTQLGVDRIIPLKTERVIVKLNRRKAIHKLERWEKIALSAAQQSQRHNLPAVEQIKDIKEVLSEAKEHDLKLIPTLTGERKSLKEVFAGSEFKNILIFIGPEGDFSPEEVELAKRAGCIPVSLGDLVLRVETAAVAVASFIKIYYDNH